VTKAKISEYSATAGDNTDVNGVNIAEGCPPSSMNNMGREIMAALKRFQVGSDGDGVTVGGALVVSGATTANTFSATAVNATGTVTFSGSVILSGTTTANTFSTDLITEKTSAAGVTIDGVLLKDSQVTTDQINEKTSAAGVTVDGVLLKDTGVGSAASPVTLNSLAYPTEGSVNFRNRIINGDMRIDQRNAGASVTPTSTAAITYTLDRWGTFGSQASKFSVQQNAGAVTPPAGFTNYLGVTSLSAYSILTADIFFVGHIIEGFNIADFAWGTANAQAVTLSFWVRSSLTGTFGGAVQNSAINRSYPFTYSISAANTWEQKTITVEGDTTGTWLTDSGRGVVLRFGLGVGATSSGTAGAWAAADYRSATGATSVVGTNGATFYITGVQLEVGSVATPFERRPFGTELALCQRYCYTLFATDCATDNFARFALGDCDLTDRLQGYVWFPVTMRVAPSLTATAANTFTLYSAGATNTCTQVNVAPTVTSKIGLTQLITSATLTAGRAGQILANNNRTAYLIYSAEL
jgi:hypothetical protein